MPADVLGRQLRDLRLSVIDRCNFRCRYCMPADRVGDDFPWLKRDQKLTFDEMIRLVRIFAQAGVVKVRITGGEPLLRARLPELIARIRAIEGIEEVAITTNGILLSQFAESLKAAGLDRVTVSLDALDETVFRKMNGGFDSPQQVLEGIEAARGLGFKAVKVNTVVQRGQNEDQILPILERFRGTGVVVRFIEFMDVGNVNAWSEAQVVPSAEIIRQVQPRWAIEPVDKRYPGEVADRYRYLDGAGEIGFVSSISQPFCKPCNRARLSADGQLYTCLFAQAGTDFRDVLRAGASNAELFDRLCRTWGARGDQYSALRWGKKADAPDEKIEMFYIGG